MNRTQLATLLDWAGDGGIQGRKRLQKVVYLLQRAGCPLNCRYTLHHFGPYSMDVADICDEMVAVKLVDEDVVPTGRVTQYEYRLPDSTRQLLAKTDRPKGMTRFEAEAKALIAEDIWSLELGSTILLYQEEGSDWDTCLRKACEFKKVDPDSASSQQALCLAKRISDLPKVAGGNMSDKVFRDPLYNYIGLHRKRDGFLIDLMATPEVQRLRRIHQLGVSNFTYPGADHTRFAHSLGVTHLMNIVLSHLTQPGTPAKVGSAWMALQATALLHDVGHGPFSHLFEPCLDIKHERWSIAVVLDEESEVHHILKREAPHLPGHVAALIDSKNTDYPPWQRALMSSQLDVDRLDYLRRDSLFTGSGYGHFDWQRLLTTVQFTDDETDLVWPEKAALAIEEYIFARYYMYQNVYLHKTTRGFEALLQAMVEAGRSFAGGRHRCQCESCARTVLVARQARAWPDACGGLPRRRGILRTGADSTLARSLRQGASRLRQTLS